MSATKRYDQFKDRMARERDKAQKFGETQAHASGVRKKKRTVSPLQWLWFLGHLFILISSLAGIAAGLTLQGKRPFFKLLYRSTFIVAVATYANSLRQHLGGELPGFFALLPVETFQYLMLAAMWLISPKHVTKLAQFMPISFMHVMDFASVYLSRKGKSAKVFNWYIENFSYRVDKTTGYINLFMFIQLAYDCLRFRSFAVTSMFFYIIFYRVRLMFAPLTRQTLDELYELLDHELSQDNKPEFIRVKWSHIKNRVLNSSYAKMEARQHEVSAIEEANAEI